MAQLGDNVGNLRADAVFLTKFEAPPLEVRFGVGPEVGEIWIIHDHFAHFSPVARPLSLFQLKCFQDLLLDLVQFLTSSNAC